MAKQLPHKSSASAAPVTDMAATAETVARVAKMVSANKPIRLKTAAPASQLLLCRKLQPQTLRRLNQSQRPHLLRLHLLPSQPRWQLHP
jgi:hypothetical protein